MPVTDDRRLFEKVILEGFQSGLSWITILKKRDNFRRAFRDFDAEKIARFTAKDVERLMNDAGIIRNRLKVEAAISNARAYLKLREQQTYANFLWGFVDGKPVINAHKHMKDVPAETELSRRISKELKRRGFKFVGPTTLYANMQSIGLVNDHLVSCHRYKPCAETAARVQDAGMSDLPSIKPPRAWQRMLSGRRLDLLEPSPEDIEFDDIAHGLARVARWNGQTLGAHALSVAQHVVVVEDIASALEPTWPNQWRLAALLHDAPEYVIGDLISPFKTAIGLDYKTFELKLLAAIHRRFGLPFPLPDAVNATIKVADRIAAFYEATGLAGFGRDEALTFFGSPPPFAPEIQARLNSLKPWSAETAQRQMVARFQSLSAP